MKITLLTLILLINLYGNNLFSNEISGNITVTGKTGEILNIDRKTFHINGFTREKNKIVFGIGAGGGIVHMIYQYIDFRPQGMNENEIKETVIKPCFSTNFKLGYAPSDRFFICWNARTNWFRSSQFSEYAETILMAGGGAGLGISFYPFKEQEKIFFSGMFGYSNLFEAFNRDHNNFGTALSFGVGYNLFKYVTAEMNFILTNSEKYSYGNYEKPKIINFTINFLYW